MKYLALVEVYEKIAETPKRLEKTEILCGFLKKLEKEGKKEWIYLLRGKVVPDYDTREYGISGQLIIKALSAVFGVNAEKILQRYTKIGDWGDIAAELAENRNQKTLFSKQLDVEKVFLTLRKILDITGIGSVERKVGLVGELLTSATGREARYIIRTVLQDLRVGVADALVLDALAELYGKGELRDKIGGAYELTNDFALVFQKASEGEKALGSITIMPGRPIQVMLPIKVETLEEAFSVVGKPAALEHKYDGFRMVISKGEEGISLFTRKLENVTAQFPDVVSAVKQNIQAESFILDAEVVGYELETKKYMPFEAISQRIKRKHDIERLIKKLPVEINVFDLLYLKGKSVMHLPFRERRILLEKIVRHKEFVIRTATQLVTYDEKEAGEFYEKALKGGEEGIILKALDAPYKQGRRVGYMVKLKPIVKDLDLVIVGAEYGSGKRAGWLTSYRVACRTPEGFADIGMVSSGLKEKQEEGTSYEEMTQLLNPLIIASEGKKVKVQPKIVVSVTYQNIQRSPSYSSGYALRFPRITHYRPDRITSDITTLKDIELEIGSNL